MTTTLRELGPDGLRRLLQKQHTDELVTGMPRKVAFARRLAVDKGKHLPLVHARIAECYQSEEARRSLAPHVGRKYNVGRRVVNALAVAYNSPPSRSLRGVDDEQQRAFLAAYREAQIDEKAETWGRYSFLLNVVHVLPRYERGQLRMVVVLPHVADVIFDPNGADEDPSILVFESSSYGARCIAVDSERWWWISKDWNVIIDEEHGMGMRPWVAFRWRARTPGEYWDHELGQELAETTIDIGRIAAHRDWVRKIRSMKLTVITVGPEDPLPTEQQANGHAPLLLRGDQVGIQTLDPTTPPEYFDRDIAVATEDMLEGLGVPTRAVDFAGQEKAGPTPADPVAYDALAKLHNGMAKHYEAGEIELAVRVGVLLRKHGRLALAPEEVREAFRIRFVPFSYADHPKGKVETAQKEMEVGATDPFEFYQSLRPGLTLEQAREEVLEHIEARSEFAEILATRNLTMTSGNSVLTVPQVQGQQGGVISGQVRNPSREEET